MAGAEITYQCTNAPGIYRVTVKAYRDCSGILFCYSCNESYPNSNGVTGCTLSSSGLGFTITGLSPGYIGTSFGNFNLPILSSASGYDIVQTCSSQKSICTNCNSRIPGTFSPGIEVFTYEGDVNLNNIPAACCKVALNISYCCREGDIVTMIPGNFFVSTELNKCQTPCNSSPVFANKPEIIVCAGLDFIYNLGAVDPDNDSLSYAFGVSLQGANTPVTYNVPFNSGYPFAYLGAPNANAPYPAGLRINPITGDIMFRPIGQFGSTLVIEVTQWKLISGTRVNVGVTRRDVYFKSVLCNPNKPPIIKVYQNGVLQTGQQNFTAFAGQPICLNIVGEDQEYSGSGPVILADTTDLTWINPTQYDSTLLNAQFNYAYNTAQRNLSGPKADSMQFCWTPPVSAIREEPHAFTVSVSDRFCPFKVSTSKAITIKVVAPKIYIKDNTPKSFCLNKTNRFNVSYEVNNINIQATNVYTVQLSDSSGNFNNAMNIGFKTDTATTGAIEVILPNNLLVSDNYKLRINSSSDTFNKGTPYVIKMVMGFQKPIITASKDSFCTGKSVQIIANAAGADLTYSWIKNGQVLLVTNDTFETNTSGTILTIASNGACADSSNQIIVVSNPAPISNFSTPDYLCLTGSSNQLNITNSSSIQAGSIQYNWLFSDSTYSTETNPSKVITDNLINLTIRLIATSSFGCSSTKEKTIPLIKTAKANFTVNNTHQCLNGNNYIFNNTSTPIDSTIQFKWMFNSSDSSNDYSPTFHFTSAGQKSISLLAITKNVCIDSFKTNVTVYQSPQASFSINNPSQCFKNNLFNFTNTSIANNDTINYLWQFNYEDSSSVVSPSYSFQSTGNKKIALYATSNNNCIDSFTLNLSVLKNPTANFIISKDSQCLSNNQFHFIGQTNNAKSHQWLFDDNTADTSLESRKAYISDGYKTIRFIAISEDMCFDTLTKNVTIFPSAMLHFTINKDSQCLRENNFVFTNSSTIKAGTINFKWLLGEYDSLFTKNASKKFDATGPFKISLVSISSNNCIDSISKTIQVLNSPAQSAIEGDTIVTNINKTYLYSVPLFQNTQYNWLVTNGNIINGAKTNSIQVNWLMEQTGAVSLTLTHSNGCNYITNLPITINHEILTNNEAFKVYPNPFRQDINLSVQPNLTGKSWRLFDIVGHTMLSQTISNKESTIDLSFLKPGIYLFSIEGINNKVKIIKQE